MLSLVAIMNASFIHRSSITVSSELVSELVSVSVCSDASNAPSGGGAGGSELGPLERESDEMGSAGLGDATLSCCS